MGPFRLESKVGLEEDVRKRALYYLVHLAREFGGAPGAALASGRAEPDAAGPVADVGDPLVEGGAGVGEGD